MCHAHSTEATREIARLKAAFISNFKDPTISLYQAALDAGTSAVTIWRWRKLDAEFDHACATLQDVRRPVRGALLVDSAFKRALAGECGDSLTKFMIINETRGTDFEYRHEHHVKQTSAEIPVDLEELTIEQLEQVKEGRPMIDVVIAGLRGRAEAEPGE